MPRLVSPVLLLVALLAGACAFSTIIGGEGPGEFEFVPSSRSTCNHADLCTNEVCIQECDSGCDSSCDSCDSSCDSSCNGSCDSCDSGCDDECDSSCDNGSDSCDDSCNGGCDHNCDGTCDNDCDSSCDSSCDGSCDSSCDDACTENCISQCVTDGCNNGEDCDEPQENIVCDDQDSDGCFATFDDYATFYHIYALAKSDDWANVNKGIDCLIDAQYPAGGWPQKPNPGNDYKAHITLNDGVHLNAMILLGEVASGVGVFGPIKSQIGFDRREAARKAWQKAFYLLWDSQIVINGCRTGWGAQHDKDTLEPRSGRAFEPASIDTRESTKIAKYLLKNIVDTSQKSRHMVQAVYHFLLSTGRPNSKVYENNICAADDCDCERGESCNPTAECQSPTCSELKDEPTSTKLWARFYRHDNINYPTVTPRPAFCDRGCVDDPGLMFDWDSFNSPNWFCERKCGYGWTFSGSMQNFIDDYDQLATNWDELPSECRSS